MAKSKKSKGPASAPRKPVTEFEVSEGGTLSVAGYAEAETRADFYENVFDQWERSPQELSDAMEECEPLAWEVYSLYDSYREELKAAMKTAGDEDKPGHKSIVALKAGLAALPKKPEEGARGWLLGLTKLDFETRILPQIREWFAEPPDWGFEDDYLPETSTAQGAALAFFRNMGSDALDLLGVVIVEGDHPGSTYYAAELLVEIADANRAAEAAGIPVRFIRGSD